MRWWTLAVLSASLLIIIVDDTIINVALPTVQQSLGGSASSLQWVVDAYILVFGGLLLTMGALGDRFGRRRLLQLGLVVFGAASVYGAYADSTTQLIAARAVMGVGGAMVMPATLSTVVEVFPRDERIRAIGIWAAIAHLGIPLGPIVGGWLLERAWWGSVLLINLPIVAVALVAGAYLIPETRHPAPTRPDLAGMVLSTTALLALVYAVIEGPAAGWWGTQVVSGVVVAALAAAWFVRHERHTDHPMLSPALIGNPRLRWGVLAVAVAIFTLAGLMFNLTQLLQLVDGYSPLAAGVRIVPLVLGFAVAAHAGAHLVAHLGTGRAAAVGFGGGAVFLAGIASMGPTAGYPLLGLALFLLGTALGVVFIPSTDAVMAAVPEADAGLGSGLNDTARQVGAALGVGVLGSLTTSMYASELSDAATHLDPRLDPQLLAHAKGSLSAALTLAPHDPAVAVAARTAFADAFSLTALLGALLLAATGLLVWRYLPAADADVGCRADAPERPGGQSRLGPRHHLHLHQHQHSQQHHQAPAGRPATGSKPIPRGATLRRTTHRERQYR